MAEDKQAKKSFWTTVPGILTGLAALITAIGGLLVAFDSSSLNPWGGGADKTAEKPAKQETPSTVTNTTSGDNSPITTGTKGDVNITIGE